MKTWYAKALSEMTHVSVRTLHHYDKIGLLKPSQRLANGYRVYSEADLFKLQRVIALKFFGFELSKIKVLLDSHADMSQHLRLQADYLKQEARALNEASHILDRVIAECGDNKSISWEKSLELIEVYQMTKHIEHEWVREVLNQDELAEYAKFEKNLNERLTQEEQKQFEKDWSMLLDEAKKLLKEDPESKKAVALAKRFMDMVDEIYGREFAGLRTALWEKGMKQGKDQGENGLSPELASWLDKAIGAYWFERVFAILNQAGSNAPRHLRDDWQNLVNEMFGNYDTGLEEFMSQLMADERLSQEQRNWLLG